MNKKEKKEKIEITKVKIKNLYKEIDDLHVELEEYLEISNDMKDYLFDYLHNDFVTEKMENYLKDLE